MAVSQGQSQKFTERLEACGGRMTETKQNMGAEDQEPGADL